MSRLKLHFLPIFPQPQKTTHLNFPTKTPLTTITCGLRNTDKKPFYRSRVLSSEAIQAVHSLKLANPDPEKLDRVFTSRISRLLKADLLDALAELRRQQELGLAILVFEYVRKEVWYEPNQSLYTDMMSMFGKKKLIHKVEALFAGLQKEGLKPNTRSYTELIGAYFRVDMVEKAIETYKLMRASGCIPDKLTLTILLRNLDNAGEEKLAAAIKNECVQYLDSPKKFLKEVEMEFPKRRSLNLV